LDYKKKKKKMREASKVVSGETDRAEAEDAPMWGHIVWSLFVCLEEGEGEVGRTPFEELQFVQ